MFRRKGETLFWQELCDPKRYLIQIDHLHKKYLETSYLYDLEQEDVSLATLTLHRRKVAKLIASSVRDGSYAFKPGVYGRVRIKKKMRVVYRFTFTDLVVHSVLASVLSEAVHPRLLPCVISYRKGVNWWTGVSAFARFVRKHRQEVPNINERGLYVIRGDVAQYTDSIPVWEGSKVWELLKDVVALYNNAETVDAKSWDFLKRVVRPVLSQPGGEDFSSVVGVPTGSPVTTVLANLYLTDLDKALAVIPGALYMRYGDDFILAHRDAAVVRRASRQIDETLDSLSLEINKKKQQVYFFNGAGRASGAWPAAKGSSSISFLGCSISFKGTVSLGKEEMRSVLRCVRRAVLRTKILVRDRPAEEKAKTICSVVNDLLDYRAPAPLRSAAVLRRCITDREQLRQLDYYVARMIAEALGRRHRVKAFSEVSYRTLRECYGLKSLCNMRNSWRKTKGEQT